MEKGKSVLFSSSTGVPKIERKIAEKNRRERMKILYSNLLCLIPNHKAMPLLDKINEVVTYIESTKIKLEEMKEKKKYLLQRKNSHSGITTEIQASPPLVEIHDMGPNMDVIFVSGLDDLSKFYNILHLLHEDSSIEVVNANFSKQGLSTFQILHDKIGKSRLGFEATTMSRRLKDLICGAGATTMSRRPDSHRDLWDCGTQSDICWFDIPEVIEAGYSNLAYCQGFGESHAYGGC